MLLHTQLSDWELCHPTARLKCYSDLFNPCDSLKEYAIIVCFTAFSYLLKIKIKANGDDAPLMSERVSSHSSNTFLLMLDTIIGVWDMSGNRTKISYLCKLRHLYKKNIVCEKSLSAMNNMNERSVLVISSCAGFGSL